MSLLNRLFKKHVDYSGFYFSVFEQLYQLEPRIFYWIQTFSNKNGRYILTHFKHPQFIKYNGLEIVIIDKSQMTYHRLPGAKPNGKGKVEIGQYSLSIYSMRESELHFLSVDKINSLELIVQSITKIPLININYSHLECRSLSYDKFIPELSEVIISALEYYYRNKILLNASLDKDLLSSITQDIIDGPFDFRIKMLAHKLRQH